MINNAPTLHSKHKIFMCAGLLGLGFSICRTQFEQSQEIFTGQWTARSRDGYKVRFIQAVRPLTSPEWRRKSD
jgi:hypothetical protein